MRWAHPPSDPADLDSWLQGQEDEMAALVTRELRRIVTQAYDEFTDSLTAAGDLGTLGSISSRWTTWVRGVFAERVAGVHLGGAFSAWLSTGDRPIPQSVARQWAKVVNSQAVEYQRTATNRLAAVGETTWRQVRAQTVRAIEQGLTNEELKNRIEDVTRFSEYRADTIARTETISAYNAGDYDAATALGEHGPVEKVWVSTRDARTRRTHREARNQCVPMAAQFEIGRYLADRPHDTSLPAGEVVNCRCTVEYLYPGDLRPDGSTVPNPDGTIPDDAQTDDGLLTDAERAEISREQDEIAERTLRRLMSEGQ